MKIKIYPDSEFQWPPHLWTEPQKPKKTKEEIKHDGYRRAWIFYIFMFEIVVTI